MKLRRFLSCMMALLLVCSLPVSAFAETWYMEDGNITVNATESGQTVSQGAQVNVPDSAPVITQKDSSTSTTNTISINADAGATAEVTLDGVNIDTIGQSAIHIMGQGNVTIELDGTNTVQSGGPTAGVSKSNGGNLTITNSDEVTADNPGSLKAIGGSGGAGIGGALNIDGSNITISGNAQVEAQGGENGAGIGGGVCAGGSNITIEDNAVVSATGGERAAGIGGGSGGGGSNITITGSAEVTATGGSYGAGIGGGCLATGSNITVSEDAQVKAQGGEAGTFTGAGAAIGNGGWEGNTGVEVAPNTTDLNEGWIATYTPGTDMDTTAPASVTYMDNNTLQTVTENITLVEAKPATCTEDGNESGFEVDDKRFAAAAIPATGHSFTNYVSDGNATYELDGTKTAKCDHCDATDTIPDPGSKLTKQEEAALIYRVIGQDGKALACKKQQKDGVLTITVEADFATLTGGLGGLKTLKAQGVDTIVFVTNGAESTFAISDLLAQGNSGDTYKLTHDGAATTFTVGAADVAGILA